MRAIDRAGKVEGAMAFADRLWKFAVAILGDKFTITTALWVGVVWTWFMSLVQSVPIWVTLLSGLAVVTLVAHLIVKLRTAWLLRGERSFDLQQFADDCLKFYQDFGAAMASFHPPPIRAPRTEEDALVRWEAHAESSRRRDAFVMERFGARAHAISHQMRLIGIPAPNLFHFSVQDSGGAAVYIGMVGELLKKGLLEQAKKLDPHQTWGSSFR